MKIITQIILVFLCSCTFKPINVSNPDNTEEATRNCYVLSESLMNRQEIIQEYKEYKKGNEVKTRVMFIYNIDEYLSLVPQSNRNSPKCYIEGLKTDYHFYSDTGSVADGVTLSATIKLVDHLSNEKTIEFNKSHRSEFYSGFFATQKRRGKEVNKVLIHLFNELDVAVSHNLQKSELYEQ